MATRRGQTKSKTSGSKTEEKQAITLKGSTKIVSEMFGYSLNSILYQRGIYPPDEFKLVKKYGLTLFAVSDGALERYIAQVMTQVKTWVLSGDLDRLVMVIQSRETRETLERWQFDIRLEETEESGMNQGKENEVVDGIATPLPKRQDKSEEQVQREIQDIMRNITSSVTFLPSIAEKCTFNILVYTNKDSDVPKEWIDSDALMITGNAEQVKLRSFSTNIHKVEALVAYRLSDT